MTTTMSPRVATSQRIHLFNDAGQHIASVSPEALAVLAECDLLTLYETLPQQRLLNEAGNLYFAAPCLHCGKEPCTLGVFCCSCFDMIDNEESGGYRAWYREEWPAAMAEREVANVAD